MTLSKHITYVAECDFCSESFDTDESDNWHWALSRMKNEGWSVYKFGGEWAHKCPVCQEQEREKRMKDDFQ